MKRPRLPARRQHPAGAITIGLARHWVIGGTAGLVALGALIVGSELGPPSTMALSKVAMHTKLIGWISAVVLLVAGIIATARLSAAFGHFVARRSVPAAAGATRILSAVIGYLFVVFAVLAVLNVRVEQLLVGAGLAGVVLGIAAQQSLANAFAGLVLLMARPFGVGDHIRIRSGALGGIFDVWVREMSLTYVTVRTDEGDLKIPNAAMLAAGVGRLAPANEAVVSSPPAPVPPVPPVPPALTETDGAGPGPVPGTA
jgi:small-conductance mechanosensitive channel